MLPYDIYISYLIFNGNYQINWNKMKNVWIEKFIWQKIIQYYNRMVFMNHYNECLFIVFDESLKASNV